MRCEMTLGQYLPSKPRVIPIAESPRRLLKELRSAAVALGKLFRLYADIPQLPEVQYPSAGAELTEEQRQQCLDIFERSEKRVRTIEGKAGFLLRMIVFLVPANAVVFQYLRGNGSV